MSKEPTPRLQPAKNPDSARSVLRDALYLIFVVPVLLLVLLPLGILFLELEEMRKRRRQR